MRHMPETLRSPITKLFICLVALSLFSGCGPGSGQGLDESGNPIGENSGEGEGEGGSGNPNATLAWVQANVFDSTCIQCHTGAGAPLGVNWSSQSDSCANVGRTSVEMPPMVLIESGNPAASYLIWKVEGEGPGGELIVCCQMPLYNSALPAETIQNMRDWISDGTLGCPTQQSTGSSTPTTTKFGMPGRVDPTGGSTYPVGSWMNVWQQTLQICETCHSIIPSNPRCSTDLQCPPKGLVLSMDNYFGVVDGVTVAPFDPDGSNLWRWVTTHDSDKRMPLGLAPLTAAQLGLILHWIADGAPFCPENEVCP